MKFALFGNTYQAKKSAHIERLLSILEKHEAEITISREFAVERPTARTPIRNKIIKI